MAKIRDWVIGVSNFHVRVLILVLLLALPISGRRYPYRNIDSYNDYHHSGMNNRHPHSANSRSSQSVYSSFPVGGLPAVQCYSCMSETYEPYLVDMSHQYRKQDLVTNRCNEPFFSRGIPQVNCSNICVTMKETIHIGGVRVVTAYIRGCLDKILTNHRFNETALLTYNFYRKDHCRELPRSMLIGPSFTGNVWFCACYGNRCNNAPISGRHFQHAGQYFLKYFFDFAKQIFWTNSSTFSKIQDQVSSWLVLAASCLLHFGLVTLFRWILLT